MVFSFFLFFHSLFPLPSSPSFSFSLCFSLLICLFFLPVFRPLSLFCLVHFNLLSFLPSCFSVYLFPFFFFFLIILFFYLSLLQSLYIPFLLCICCFVAIYAPFFFNFLIMLELYDIFLLFFSLYCFVS